MFAVIKNTITDRLFILGLELFKSRMGKFSAKPYAIYLQHCQKSHHVSSEKSSISKLNLTFQRKGFVTYWSEKTKEAANSILAKIQAAEVSGTFSWAADYTFSRDVWHEFPEIEQIFRSDLEPFFKSIYGCNVKIFFGRLFKSVPSFKPEGSQLWHADGGPGTCINALFYLCETNSQNGAMEIIDWDDSLAIFRSEKKAFRHMLAESVNKNGAELSRVEARARLATWFGGQIAERKIQTFRPSGEAGLVLAFRNNNIHKGGYPEEGYTRYAIVFHIYPANMPLDYDRYHTNGVSKTAPYPADPAF
jgi:hypothetical protein